MFILKPKKVYFNSGSVVIALPPDWASHHNLKKGSYISLGIDEKQRLILEPYKEDSEGNMILNEVKQ